MKLWTSHFFKRMFLVFFYVPRYIRKIKGFILLGTYRVSIGSNVRFNFYYYKSKKFGKGFTIYDNAIIELHGYSEISIGEYVILSYGSIISCAHKIEIGHHTMIGEYVTIRDSTHDYKSPGIIYGKKDIEDKIIIGNNVWIGRGTIIMPGTIIEDNVIVGANSVVKGTISKDSIIAGAPAKLIRMKEDLL